MSDLSDLSDLSDVSEMSDFSPCLESFSSCRVWREENLMFDGGMMQDTEGSRRAQLGCHGPRVQREHDPNKMFGQTPWTVEMEERVR